MPYRMFLLVVVCQNTVIRSPGLLLQFSVNSVIASREPTSRAPCLGFSTVPIMDCAVWSREFPLERFASTTTIASYSSLWISVVWSVKSPFHDKHGAASTSIGPYDSSAIAS